MPKHNIDYSNTIIYKIYCKDTTIDDVYIGHTTNFVQRKCQHKTCCNNLHNKFKIYEIIRQNGGWDNWDMIEIATHNCKNHTEARIKEHEYYEKFNSTLNSVPPFINKNNLFCETCNITYISNKDYNNHISCKDIKQLAKNEQEIIKNEENHINVSKKFCCELCNFKCFKKSNWLRHIARPKHQKAVKDNIKDNKDNQKNALPDYVCECGKNYAHQSGLSRHKNAGKCLPSHTPTFDDITDVKMLANLVIEVVKQNQELVVQNNETQKQNQELTNKLFEICKNGTTNNNTLINNNSHNKTFNLNVFLNENCKDAMNIMDFVDSLKLQLSDLENVGKLGFVQGISNIIVKNLKALDVHKRPVHCSDSKREVMYIKDEDKWEKENEERVKLRKAIKYIAHKNSKLIPEFRAKYPDCGKSDSMKSDQFNKLVIEAMGGAGDNDMEKEDKIIKKIAKEVLINKNM